MVHSLLVNANIQELTAPAPRMREAYALADALMMRVSHICAAPSTDAREPLFYIPLRGNRSQPPKLITGRQLRARWIAENAYELEAMRLLALTGRGREPVEYMLDMTDKRLRLAGACRPNADGELVTFTLAALRFWSAHRPMDWTLQERLLAALKRQIGADERFISGDAPPFYVWLTLATTPCDMAEELLRPSLQRLRALDALPWPDAPAQKLRRAVVAAAVNRCEKHARLSHA